MCINYFGSIGGFKVAWWCEKGDFFIFDGDIKSGNIVGCDVDVVCDDKIKWIYGSFRFLLFY